MCYGLDGTIVWHDEEIGEPEAVAEEQVVGAVGELADLDGELAADPWFGETERLSSLLDEGGSGDGLFRSWAEEVAVDVVSELAGERLHHVCAEGAAEELAVDVEGVLHVPVVRRGLVRV